MDFRVSKDVFAPINYTILGLGVRVQLHGVGV